MFPREREVNLDNIAWARYEDVVLYCGVTKAELSHLSGPHMIQNRVVYRVGAPVTRTAGDFWLLGIPLNISWAGYSRTVNINCEDENKNRNGNENGNGNENENDNGCGGGVGYFVNTMAAIALEGDHVDRKEWPSGR